MYSVCCEENAFVVPNKLRPKPKVKRKRDVSDWCLYVYVRVCVVCCAGCFCYPNKAWPQPEAQSVCVCVCVIECVIECVCVCCNFVCECGSDYVW